MSSSASPNPLALQATLRRRSWWSLRLWILAILLGMAAPVGWVFYQNHQQARAIARVSELGGTYQQGTPTYPRWAERIRAFVGNQLLRPFEIPGHYKRVDLFFKPVTDADLELIGCIPNLTQLDLMGTKITDRGVGALRHQTRLESLELAHTAITDASLVHLKDMKNLRRLRLEHCKITDAVIPLLRAIGSNALVCLQGTRVTAVRAGQLRIATTEGKEEPIIVGEMLLIQGSCTVADAGYDLEEIEISVLGKVEGSNEMAILRNGKCKPTRHATEPGRFDYRLELQAPNRIGKFKVSATTYAHLQGFLGAYTVGSGVVRTERFKAERR